MTGIRPAGYLALIERFDLDIIPNWHQSFIVSGGSHRLDVLNGYHKEFYPNVYWPGDGVGDHLEFALKYDGTNPAILAQLFRVVDPGEVTAYIQSRPFGKFARRIWYLFESITRQRLPLEDLTSGNYIDVLEPQDYFVLSSPRRIRRQRVRDNLLGGQEFSPFVRRTPALIRFEKLDLVQSGLERMASFSPDFLQRAMRYMYTKETRSSFQIENLNPSAQRIERFVALLRLAEGEDFLEKGRLLDLQNRIVDPRFRDHDYRKSQNYIGQTIGWQQEKIHYISPRPDDLPDLMEGLLTAHHRMEEGAVHPVVHAAVVAFGFVYLHPYEDGNGRIHRFLIHNILARRGFTPPGMIFPISAAMLKDARAYDDSLEAFSQRLLPLIDYSLDRDGIMVVRTDGTDLYRFLDLTEQTEALFGFIDHTLHTELIHELVFLESHDRAKKAVQEIVDMPDRQIELFIRLCMQNRGQVSKRKRASAFPSLTDREINRMEKAVAASFRSPNE